MNDHEFDQKLACSAGHLSEEDGVAAGKAIREMAAARQETLRQTAAALQESLDSLRLSVKYLMFDLEATRRENEVLKQRLKGLEGTDPAPPT